MVSVYIHIPFCNSICTYCDFCKLKYDKKWINDYLDSLKEEVINNYKGEDIKTLYIGGGTPSILSIDELNKLFEIVNLFKLEKLEEFTFECNIESITNEKLILLKKNNVNRLSIGIETFNPKFLKLLNRHHTKEEVFDKIELAKMIGFNNINVDLMYALPGETIEDVESDIDEILKLNVSHISCYSLMIMPNTKLYIDKYSEIDEDADYDMYKYIEKRLTNRGYNHYEISNYAIPGYESKHNINYWLNGSYYGFGLSAVSFINNHRISNTKNLTKYLKDEYLTEDNYEDATLSKENDLILGLRLIEGLRITNFNTKYNDDILRKPIIKELLSDNYLIVTGDKLHCNYKYIYLLNSILEKIIGSEL